MEQIMHINVSIPVTITHVKENRKTEEKSWVFFVDTMIMLAIFIRNKLKTWEYLDEALISYICVCDYIWNCRTISSN
jgi:hypothetical protein